MQFYLPSEIDYTFKVLLYRIQLYKEQNMKVKILKLRMISPCADLSDSIQESGLYSSLNENNPCSIHFSLIEKNTYLKGLAVF